MPAKPKQADKILRPLFSTRPEHLQKLVNLDHRSVPRPWAMSQFTKIMGQPKVHTVGAFDCHDILHGYLIYDFAEPNRVSIVSLVVDFEVRRVGFGTFLMNELRDGMRKALTDGRIVVHVDEENALAISFLTAYARKSGASLRTSLIRGEPRDVYCFVIQDQKEPACV